MTPSQNNGILGKMKTKIPRIYAIGDIHGCYDTLMALFGSLAITDEDTVIVCGDLVDRGPKIKEVLDLLLNRPNTLLLLGNHDMAFIQYVKGHIKEYQFMFHQGLSDTLKQLGGKAMEYAEKLHKLPFKYDFPKYGYVFCHASYPWREDEQWSEEHLWERDMHMHPENFPEYNGPVIVHGHTPVLMGNDYYEKVGDRIIGINLDGGCFTGYKKACLRALCVNDGSIHEEPNVDKISL